MTKLVENADILRPFISEPIQESVAGTRRVIKDLFGGYDLVEPGAVQLVSGGEIERIGLKNFKQQNLVASMMEEFGLPASHLFTPSDAAVADVESGKVYISREFFKPMQELQIGNYDARPTLSRGAAYVFYAVSDAVMPFLAAEEEVEPDPFLSETVVSAIPIFLRSKPLQNPEESAQLHAFSESFENFMRGNVGELTYTAQGARIHVNVGGRRIFSAFSPLDTAARSLLLQVALDLFQKEMRKGTKNYWFSAMKTEEAGFIRNPEEEANILTLVKEINPDANMNDFFQMYVDSVLGKKIRDISVVSHKRLLLGSMSNVLGDDGRPLVVYEGSIDSLFQDSSDDTQTVDESEEDAEYDEVDRVRRVPKKPKRSEF